MVEGVFHEAPEVFGVPSPQLISYGPQLLGDCKFRVYVLPEQLYHVGVADVLPKKSKTVGHCPKAIDGSNSITTKAGWKRMFRAILMIGCTSKPT